ncbi:hypothetical protein IWW50_005187, partial [Coemansia erecta]
YSSDPRVVSPTFRAAPGEDAWLAGLEGEASDVAEIAQALQADGEWVYQLYVSYFEVYNEMVYDLLDLTTLTTVEVRADAEGAVKTRGRPKGRRQGRGRKRDEADDPLSMSAAQIAGLTRSALVLRTEGGRGNEAFVDGVTEVRVRTVQDLVRVLIHGQLRRSVHATGLNSGSSRSHALFQAKLVKMRRDASVVPLSAVPAAAQASIRTMTVVDLAGSERAKRTQTHGDRLAEAGKINVSLMTLKKCLDVRRFNAALEPGDTPQLVPYNESKVTRLFQPALEGGAKTVMVVCIDPYEHAQDPEPLRSPGSAPSQSFTETKNVLDFARVASSLVAKVRRVHDPPVMQLEPPAESPTARGSPTQGADNLADDSEDEIFFDTDAERAGRKRAASTQCVDKGVQTDEASSMSAKRQRRDLGGDWQHPSTRPAPTPRAAASASRRPMTPRMASMRTGDEPQTEWDEMTRGSEFSFEAAAPQAGLQLTQGLAQGSELREMQRLRAALSDAQARLSAEQSERAQEVDELVAYAEALDACVGELRTSYLAAQERALRVEEETRAEAAAFFVEKLAQVQAQAGERLQDELHLSEQKAAHKLDILSRLRQLRGGDSDDELGAAEVPTVSPRTAVRRAVSRAASKKANKYASVSAGESRELANTRQRVESLEAQVSSQATQLEMIAQARTADRARGETLEHALVEANGHAAALEARLLRVTSAHSPEAELAITRAHERERAEFLAQITMLKQRLRDAETHSMRARRQWETQELLPVQERMRAMMSDASSVKRDGRDMDVSEALERAERDRDNAWAWWTREQERNSQVCAQNDVLMREIRQLRARIQDAEPPSPRIECVSENMSDSDESFCKVSIHDAGALSAINGGNPLGASAMTSPSQTSVGPKPLTALDRVISKGGRVLHRNPNARAFAASAASARESTESVLSPSSIMSPTREGRAKRVVSRVFNFTPGSRRNDSARPYMAGRFAHTDTAVGSYSAEVFSYENGNGNGRARGDTIESVDSDTRQAKVRSIVYSGPIVAHKTGGVSVTFTSQEVNDLPLGAEPIPEQSEEDD